jgi:hypothetical protein
MEIHIGRGKAKRVHSKHNRLNFWYSADSSFQESDPRGARCRHISLDQILQAIKKIKIFRILIIKNHLAREVQIHMTAS